MFIQTEETPNPNSFKFIPGTIISDQPVYYSTKEEAGNQSLLAVKLFNIEGVKSVFFGSDFITITKMEEKEWNILKPEILMIIMDHFEAGFPVFDNKEQFSSKISSKEFSNIEKQIIEIIETRVRPSVAMDGGDIIYKGFEDGIVKLELHGACSGCPSSTITLKNGIESMLKHYVPDVIAVEAINNGD